MVFKATRLDDYFRESREVERAKCRARRATSTKRPGSCVETQQDERGGQVSAGSWRPGREGRGQIGEVSLTVREMGGVPVSGVLGQPVTTCRGAALAQRGGSAASRVTDSNHGHPNCCFSAF